MASLNPHTGLLGKRLAAHLLRRATFHIPPQRIDTFALMTADATVDELCDTIVPFTFPNGPINYNTGNPLFNPTTIRIADGTGVNDFFQYLALMQWRLVEAYFDTSIRHKMIFFLSSNWVVNQNDLSFPENHYTHSRLLHHMALGNMQDFAFKVTLDMAMMQFLNNGDNTAANPNENYGREFLELFTILRGETIAIGNYTNYTEADIKEAARILTGYKEISDDPNLNAELDEDTGLGRAIRDFSDHDTEDKTFSAAFQNQVITGAIDEADMHRELKDFIAMVFNQLETAKAYCRKLYRFFVSDIIDATIENDIIAPLADDLLANGYEILPVLKRLLKSQHFFGTDDFNPTNNTIGGKIKSPIELLVTSASTMNGLNVPLTDYNQLFNTTAFHINFLFERLQMSQSGPDSVEGFFGYYKAPGFSRNWFNSNTLFYRYNIATYLLRGWWDQPFNPIPFKVDMMNFVVNNISDPADGTTLVSEFMECFLPEQPTGKRFDYFLNALYGDLSPTNWFFAWQNYLDTNDDTEVRIGVENLYLVVFNSPEFQLF